MLLPPFRLRSLFRALFQSRHERPRSKPPRWGSEALSPAEFIGKVRDAGYNGIEAGLADGDAAADEVLARAKDAGLAVITQHPALADHDPRLAAPSRGI